MPIAAVPTLCPRCNYDTSVLAADAPECPECGRRFMPRDDEAITLRTTCPLKPLLVRAATVITGVSVFSGIAAWATIGRFHLLTLVSMGLLGGFGALALGLGLSRAALPGTQQRALAIAWAASMPWLMFPWVGIALPRALGMFLPIVLFTPILVSVTWWWRIYAGRLEGMRLRPGPRVTGPLVVLVGITTLIPLAFGMYVLMYVIGHSFV